MVIHTTILEFLKLLYSKQAFQKMSSVSNWILSSIVVIKIFNFLILKKRLESCNIIWLSIIGPFTIPASRSSGIMEHPNILFMLVPEELVYYWLKFVTCSWFCYWFCVNFTFLDHVDTAFTIENTLGKNVFFHRVFIYSTATLVFIQLQCC